MRKFSQEFKEFIVRGNVMDMAIGIVIGAAFTAIVNSLVNDIIMPVVGYLTAGIDFADLSWELRTATETAEAVTINYGMFINAVISFLIVAFVLFLIVKVVNRLRRKEEVVVEEEPAGPSETELLQEILVELRRKG